MKQGLKSLIVTTVIAVALVACGSDGADTTTADTQEPSSTSPDTTATTNAPATTAAATTTVEADEDSSAALDVMSAECVEGFIDYLHALEPIVEGFDFIRASDAEFEALAAEVQPIEDEYQPKADELGCPDVDTRDHPELMAAMIQLAEDEAPGAAPMFQWIAMLGGYYKVATGDCATDLAAFEAYIDENVVFSNLTFAEYAEFRDLSVSLLNFCRDQFDELAATDKYKAFSEG
jgi:hypothetical protein